MPAATLPPAPSAAASGVYWRHRPEETALYEVVRDNLETLYGAIDDGALAVRIPKHARKELDGALLGRLTRIFVETVHRFYAELAAKEGAIGAKSGAVTVVQRTSSDLRLNPHLHAVFLDGAWQEESGELAWVGLGHLKTSEVGDVLERAVRRIERHLRRRGLLRVDEDGIDPNGDGDPEGNLAASAVSGQAPPAGPQWVSGLAPLEPHALAYDKPLCASLDGFTLHAATRAGTLDPSGREALLRYVLRPPIAQERVEPREDGLVRITLKKAYSDGTVAVDMDPRRCCAGWRPASPRRASTPCTTRACSRRRASGGRASRRKRPRRGPLPAASPDGASARRDIAPGRSCWRAPSPWTCSPVPAARGG